MMSRARAVFGCCFSALLFTESAFADDSAPPPPQSEPIEVVVTGSRTEERIDRAASATEVIRRSEIEQSGARDAAELLEERPGLQVVRSFRGSELQLRGLDPEYTLILIDGERVPGQIDGAIDLTRYGSENIERIEIVRGPGSALYGSDAIGGVINILTRESRRDFEANALASYGQRNTLDLTGNVAGRATDKLHLQLTADWHRSDAYTRPGERDTSVSARDQALVGARISYELDSHNMLVLRGSYLRSSFEGVDAGAGGALFDRQQVQEQPRVGFEHRLRASDAVKLTTRLVYSQFRDQYLSDQRNATELDRVEDNREHLGQLTSIASIAFSDAQRTTVGFEELFQRLDSERLERRGQRFRFAGFIQHAWLVYKDGEAEFEVVPGFRFDADSQFGREPSPKIALRYKPLGFLEFRASYGHGFRAPTFQELLLRFENPSVGYIVIGSTSLGAETSNGFDAAARLFNETFELNVTFFRNDLNNMIAYVMTNTDASGMVFTYDNLETAWTMGVESALSAKLRDQLSVTLGHTWLDTWDHENGRPLQGRPTHRLTANVRVAHPTWELDFVARAAVSFGRRFYVLDEQAGDEERTVIPKPLAQLDLRVAKHFGRALELFVGVDNLVNAGDPYTALRPFTVYGGARGRY